MAFEALGRSLGEAVRRLLRLPAVDEQAIKELVRDLQRTLLQADVNVNLVLDISKKVEERSLHEKLPPGISRREHVVKVLYEELTRFLGEEPAKTTIQPAARAHTMMLVGIQGTGKTTTTVKLARFYQKRGLRVGVVCTDTFRPGAYQQLEQLSAKARVPLYGNLGQKNPEKIAAEALRKFQDEKMDLIIIDTAGRHRKEEDLMHEMKDMASRIKPDEIILSIDATIGQQALAQARAFHEATPIGSIFLTKLDGSAKGGGAISAVAATGAKIKFVGTGENIDDLEAFNPSSFAGRILGIGDIKSLVEKVREAEVSVSKEKTKAFIEGKFTLRDMYEQMENLRKMGPLRKLWSMMPGGVSVPQDQVEVAEKKLDAWRVIIQSMTRKELEDPKIIDSSRAKRISRGSGRSEREVKELVNQYFTMRKMMKSMRGGRQASLLKRFGLG